MTTLLALLLCATPAQSPPPDANATRRGLVNTTTQSFSGQKTFTDGGVVIDGPLTVDGGARISGTLNVDAGITQNGGQPVVSATAATVALFVDPAGSDSNTCLASGTSNACLTMGGAFAKLPRFLQHNITITVATGTYTTAWANTTPLVLGQGVSLTINGTMATSTVATGTATGTCTAAAAGSNSGPATCTDSGQSWTTDDMKGKFITFSSGSLSGQSFPIVTNSGTVITFPSTTSSGTVGYTIQEPGPVWSTSGPNSLPNIAGNGSLTVNNVKFIVSAGNGLNMATTAITGPTITWQSCSWTASAIALSVASGNNTVRRSYVKSTGSYGISVLQSNPMWGPNLTATNCFVIASAALFTGILLASPAEIATSPVGSTAVEVSTGVGIAFSNGQTGQNPGVWVTCTTAGSGTGIQIGTPISSTAAGTMSSHTFVSNIRITGCGTGFRVASGPANATLSSITFDTVTTAVSVTKGGVLDFMSGTPTFTGVTNELSLDGTAYTFAALVAAGPPAVLTNTYGSKIIR